MAHPASQDRAGALRAEPPSASQAKPLIPLRVSVRFGGITAFVAYMIAVSCATSLLMIVDATRDIARELKMHNCIALAKHGIDCTEK